MTTTSERTDSRTGEPVIGDGATRVDGPLKVTGDVPYADDLAPRDALVGVLVGSTATAGTLTLVDTTDALAAPGVVEVITHHNAPQVVRPDESAAGRAPVPPFQDDQVRFRGDYVALVVAQTREEAVHAASLLHVHVDDAEPVVDLNDPRATREDDDPVGADSVRGDLDRGLAEAEVVVEADYVTGDNTNNPIGLSAACAQWDGDALTMWATTQWPFNVAASLAEAFGVPREGVQVLCPYLGGGFGSGLRPWPFIHAAAMAARVVGRPVRVVLSRPQMFTGIGHRPETVQRVRLGARRDGTLTAIEHTATVPVALDDDNPEDVVSGTRQGYAVEHLRTDVDQVRLHIPPPGSMRAPGEAQGNFALETALDELAVELGVDPVELRLRNYAHTNPDQDDLPWSSKALDECLRRGAELIGWDDRDPTPRSMRDGDDLVGYGMAAVSFFYFQQPCSVRLVVRADGTAAVHSSAMDIGTGTYTVVTQVAARHLGLDLSDVEVVLGDSSLPASPPAGGSGLAMAITNAVARAAASLLDDLGLGEAPGRDALSGAVGQRDEVSAEATATPPDPAEVGMSPSGAFGAKFAKVRVDADLGLVRVERLVSVVDCGEVLNERTARSQVVGGTVGGIGHALLEHTVTDLHAGPQTGRITNAHLADYLVAVSADVPDLEVEFVGGPDRLNPVGVKGVGEIGLCGVAAAIGNAVFHATGRRVRRLPITPDLLL